MLDDFKELETFARIASSGTLSGAAQELGVALSVVSKRLASLEARTNTRLIARSTRKLSLTDEGTALLVRVQRILADISEAEIMLSKGKIDPRGLLRVSAPVALGRSHVAPICRELSEKFCDLTIDLHLTDRVVGLIDEGFDVAIRIGEPSESGLAVRRLAPNHRIVVASEGYLKSHPPLHTPEDISSHQCLDRPSSNVWHLIGPSGEKRAVEINSRLRCDNGEVWRDWALDGAGLALKSWVDVASDIREGRLVHVLPTWHSVPTPVCAIIVAGTMVPTRLRVFLDAVAYHLKGLDMSRSETQLQRR